MKIEFVDMTQFKCVECNSDLEVELVEKDGKNPMALTTCEKCGTPLKVVKIGESINVEATADNP